MISALFFLIAQLGMAQISIAQDSSVECNRLMSRAAHESSRSMFAGLSKSKAMLFNVTQALGHTEALMKDAVSRKITFNAFKEEAKQKNLKIYDVYHERVYGKLYLAKNCPDSVAEAAAPKTDMHSINTPNDDFFNRQVDDVMRGLGPAPGTATPAESER